MWRQWGSVPRVDARVVSLLCIFGIHRWTVNGLWLDGSLRQAQMCMRCKLRRVVKSD